MHELSRWEQQTLEWMLTGRTRCVFITARRLIKAPSSVCCLRTQQQLILCSCLNNTRSTRGHAYSAKSNAHTAFPRSVLVDYPTFSPFLPQQTEIAKRLNAILAQIMPFLSQEVSVEIFNQWHIHWHHFLNMLIVQMY